MSISIAGLTHSYRGTTALDHVDLELGVGVTGLLGPNGAGKTTLLRILATVLGPEAGQVRVLGNDPTADPRQLTAVRRNLGYVPQELGFPRGFTTFAFVDYLAVLKEWADRDARHTEVRRVLELVDLTDRSTKRIRTLSGGQRRRLAVAQALLGDPRILLLDEPTTGLDPQQRAGLRAVLSAAGERASVLLSTHQTEDVSALCDRVVVLDGGRVRFNGAVVELVATAAGRVWLADSPDPSAQASWRTGTGRYRHVGHAPPGAELVEPSLEDAYLILVGSAAGVSEVAA